MDNPYQAPAAIDPRTTSTSEVSADIIRILAGTKGWVRFLAVLGFIGCAFILIGALGLLAAGSNALYMVFPKAALILVYLGVGAAYFYAAYKLNQFASRIGWFLQSPSQTNLADALDAQRGFWKYAGMMAVIFIVLYILVIGLAVGSAI